uniref:Uncharacterized protein n=1 Tax=Anguilla anguilla TaxID=7936 RepID=A0A0E9XHQ9_ANGAN
MLGLLVPILYIFDFVSNLPLWGERVCICMCQFKSIALPEIHVPSFYSPKSLSFHICKAFLYNI